MLGEEGVREKKRGKCIDNDGGEKSQDDYCGLCRKVEDTCLLPWFASTPRHMEWGLISKRERERKFVHLCARVCVCARSRSRCNFQDIWSSTPIPFHLVTNDSLS